MICIAVLISVSERPTDRFRTTAYAIIVSPYIPAQRLTDMYSLLIAGTVFERGDVWRYYASMAYAVVLYQSVSLADTAINIAKHIVMQQD